MDSGRSPMIKMACMLIILSVRLGVVCTPQSQRVDDNQMSSSDIVAVVIKTLESRGRSGSLIYRGSCTPSGGIKDSFKVAAIKGENSALETLHAAFKNDSTLTVKEDASGLIQIIGGNVQTDLLQLKLHKVAFKGEGDPRNAVNKLLANPEIKGYMQANHIKFITLIDGLIPPPSGARLSATLKDATLSQALDQIVQSFPGVWIYGECGIERGERHVYILFHEFSARPPVGTLSNR